MLSIGPTTKVYLRPGPTDLRLGYEGLTQLARTQLTTELLGGRVFAFCNQSRTRLKLLTHDGYVTPVIMGRSDDVQVVLEGRGRV